ncbi:MAG TPA: thioredoxin domain-containing protein [Vicinamibacteria bacterium]|nr:thioredoxin domain-containing protein [Vicinamibacteria bacterium]
MTNRLARESSPYLLLHAENPVDWYPWGDEAFEKARGEDKPIFLSVGYSTCYWCHVMERESFSDAEIARELNEHFVSIKLDREERPDLDEIYMTATQLLTQSGGWPNSLFLTHDLKPFFAGTYFPPSDRQGRPGFPRILQAIREAWALRRVEVVEQAEALAEAIRAQAAADQSAALPDAELADEAQALLSRRFDATWGGFSRAPKFPSPSNLFLLLDRAASDAKAREMLVVTLDRMARGGIQDQLGGGFHRYSVDAQWLVPHFEKMLYDNAAMARLYAEAAPHAPAAGFERVARATLDFVLAELHGDHGGFLSALDAETDGDEGAYYTWTAEELRGTLGTKDFELFAAVYGFDGPPNFEHGRYVLHLPQPLADRARSLGGVSVEELLRRLEPGRRALLAARALRKRPLVDDKVLADWNGMMIAAMTRCGALLREQRFLDAGARAARFVLETLRLDEGGRLAHAWRAGRAKVDALLDDYAFMVEALVELHDATGESAWLDEACRLHDEQDRRLWDEAGGGYFNAGDDPRLLVRSKAAHDGAVASANGVAASNLVALADRTGEDRYSARAETLLRAFGRSARQYPLGHVSLVRAAARYAAPHGGERLRPARRERDVAAPAPAPAKPAEDATEVVTVQGSVDRSASGPWKPFKLDLAIRGGFHLNANPPLLRFMVATEVRGLESEVRALRYPKTDRYEGRVTIEGEVESPEGRPAVVALTYQACDEERCLLPVTRDVVLE